MRRPRGKTYLWMFLDVTTIVVSAMLATFIRTNVKGGAKVDHWGGAKGYQ